MRIPGVVGYRIPSFLPSLMAEKMEYVLLRSPTTPGIFIIGRDEQRAVAGGGLATARYWFQVETNSALPQSLLLRL